jgi:hypothetical protein
MLLLEFPLQPGVTTEMTVDEMTGMTGITDANKGSSLLDHVARMRRAIGLHCWRCVFLTFLAGSPGSLWTFVFAEK